MSSSAPLRAAVAGASGYIGIQCATLLLRHPAVRITQLSARSAAGKRHSDVVPGSGLDIVMGDDIDPSAADVIFACLPHTVAAAAAPRWLSGGALVVDLSADFRLHDAADFETWYGSEHPSPSLLEESVYALPELPWTDVSGASLLAMPGCYATATLLACAPALIAGIAAPAVTVDAKSGVSGAGRSPSLTTHFSEVNESVRAYSVDGHRHMAEILQELRHASAAEPSLTFVPHLIPMTRGILVTAYLHATPDATREMFEQTYREFCAAHPFLRYDSTPPATKSVAGTNMAALNVAWQNATAIVTCAIDNLLKGAAGQAVQAFNIRYGLAETTGLEAIPTWP